MKPRTIIATLELETDTPIKDLIPYIKNSIHWEAEDETQTSVKVNQVKIQVAQPPKLIKRQKR